jgi:hypothetical protein
MKGWADKKLLEFIGTRERDITAYVLELLSTRRRPKKILAKALRLIYPSGLLKTLHQVMKILDEDAEDFAVKLVRRLHFEIVSAKTMDGNK